MRYLVRAILLLPVETFVEAETQEEAVKTARERYAGQDIEKDWVLDESKYGNEGYMN